MAPVQVVETFEVNVNVSKLEHLLHVSSRMLGSRSTVVAEDGTYAHERRSGSTCRSTRSARLSMP